MRAGEYGVVHGCISVALLGAVSIIPFKVFVKRKMYKPIAGLNSRLVVIKCKEQKDGSSMLHCYI